MLERGICCIGRTNVAITGCEKAAMPPTITSMIVLNLVTPCVFLIADYYLKFMAVRSFAFQINRQYQS